jgi:two-component system NtrC family sensor kinase
MPCRSLRTKLIASFSIVILLGVFLSVMVGIRLIGDTIIRQARDKVRLDLNSAREVYTNEARTIESIVRLTSNRFFLVNALIARDRVTLQRELGKIRKLEGLDILTLTDNHGRVFARARNPDRYGDMQRDAIVEWVINNHEKVVSTQIVEREELEKESEALSEQAVIEMIPTPKARTRPETVETSGMVIKAAAPVYDYDGHLIGILYGGSLINKNYNIVDRVKNIVYRDEQYKGRDVGTATIFQGDLRISTNVMRNTGERAIGTRVSQEVYDHVIGKGMPWIGRAFVVNDWYITSYEPIKDIRDRIIGMLYVGMLEEPYVDLRKRVVFIFIGIGFLSAFLLSIIANFVTNRIVFNPVRELLFATQRVARGDLTYRVPIVSNDEIGQLGTSFNQMTIELQKLTDNYQNLTRTLEEKVDEKTKELKEAQDILIQSEKMASLGKMAAGVAHEINNPLTSILINSHLIAERLEGDGRFDENLKLIIEETERTSAIVSGLLEFSRQTTADKEPADIHEVLEKSLFLLKSPILVHKVTVQKEIAENLPRVMIDVNKIEQVFTNVILNALDAMPNGGTLRICSKVSEDNRFVEVTIQDDGGGIPEDIMDKIFDPFFTTKGMKGTGLGLSISYGIIQQHGGSIDVKSEVGVGTKLTVYLPLYSSE